MLVAVVATLFEFEIVEYQWIAIAIVAGVALGVPLGLLVPMTAVPQRTALVARVRRRGGRARRDRRVLPAPPGDRRDDHGRDRPGGRARVPDLHRVAGRRGQAPGPDPGPPWVYRGQNIVNLSILGTALLMVAALVARPDAAFLFPIAVALSLVFGVLLVIRIGGADMPTVISLLNGFAGLSASMMGFVLDNNF